MAEESRMNLAALQQRDPYITDILDRAGKVTLYKFSHKNSNWSVTDIEGSLFVYKRSASPTYGLIILNRKDLNNLVQPLTHQVEFHLNTPFLLYKRLSDDLEDAIHGIWFVDRDECIRLTETIQRLVREVSGRADGRRPETENTSDSQKSAAHGQNILSLLSNAQKTYDQERGGAAQDHAEARPIKHASGDASGMSQISLDDLFRTVNLHQAKAGMTDSGTDTGSKAALFARSVSVTELEAQTQQEASSTPQEDKRHPILRMISHKTVEEIEKQHLEEHKRLKDGAASTSRSSKDPKKSRSPRSKGGPPPPSTSTETTSGGPTGGSGTGGGIDLMQLLTQGASKLNVKQEVVGDVGDVDHRQRQVRSSPSAGGGVDAVKRLITMQDPQFGTNRAGFIPVPTGAQQLSDVEGSHPAARSSTGAAPSLLTAVSAPSRKNNSSGPRPVILKPSDLDPSLAKSPPGGPSGPSPLSASVNSLLTPQAFADRPLSHDYSTSENKSGPPATSSTSVTAPAPLTRDQLQQAMIHLIKNDSSFVNTLHAAYLESFHEATSSSKRRPSS